MKKQKNRRRSSRLIAPLGLTIVGAGVCVIGEAITIKMQSDSFWDWFLMGTLGLVIFNTGLSVFGKAVVRKTKEDLEEWN